MPNQSPTNSQGKTAKNYSGIQISGALFLILIIVILAVNIVITHSLKQDSLEINLAGRQRMLSQRIAKSVSSIVGNVAENNPSLLKYNKEELLLSHDLFDKTLTGFKVGGKTKGATGDFVDIKEVTNPVLIEDLNKADAIWKVLSPDIIKVANSSLEELAKDQKALDQLSHNVQKDNLVLLKLMNNLTVALEKKASEKSSMLQLILGVALLLEVVNFGYIIVHSIGHLKRRDSILAQYSNELEQKNDHLAITNNQLATTQNELNTSNASLQEALYSVQSHSEEATKRANELEELSIHLNQLKEESDSIFSSVDHGLCLIDPQYVMGQRISTSMYKIFETEHLSGVSFVELMRPLITSKDLSTLENYLKLQFNGKTIGQQLSKFNPLKNVEITLNWDGKSFVNKHLNFEFQRIMSGDQVLSVLVTITDVTETVVLENELKKANKEQELKTNLILDIIQTDTDELNLFLAQTTRTLDEVNLDLRQQGVEEDSESADGNKELVESIFAKVHNIKGNAGLLKLKTIAAIASSVEDDMQTLRSKDQITGDEFLSSIVHLATLRERVGEYQELQDTILKEFTHHSAPVKETPATKSESLMLELSGYADKVASDLGKKVYIYSDFDADALDGQSFTTTKDVLIQLVRNSISHGIETPAERLSSGKMEEGMILIKSVYHSSADNILNEPAYEFVFRDDGKGLDLEQIRKTAIENDLIAEEESHDLEESELAKLIFHPGFSTAEEVDMHSGRGSGMYIIKKKVLEDLGGKIAMHYVEGQFMQISWFVPKKAHLPMDRGTFANV